MPEVASDAPPPLEGAAEPVAGQLAPVAAAAADPAPCAALACWKPPSERVAEAAPEAEEPMVSELEKANAELKTIAQ
eukprot:10189245-Alexandrium_andersonii.AAC.1